MLFLTEGEAATNALSDMSGLLDALLLLMLGLVAIYGFYTVIRLKKTYMLFPNKFLYPTGCTAETCIDEGAYIDYIIPKLTILSTVCLVLTAAYAVRVFLFPQVIHWAIDVATLTLPFGILLWYAIIQNKVAKTFW